MLTGNQKTEGGRNPLREGLLAALPLGVLHLGVKTALLVAAGFRTIGDVRNVRADTIARVPSVGWLTVEQLVRNRTALFGATLMETDTDWAGYCKVVGVPLLPEGGAPATGKDFLEAIPVFFGEVAASLPDESLTIILRDRICQPPGRQKTLDEIAMLTSPPLTRERIRQKEKKLLGQLTGGLLNDSYQGLDIHFHPGFAHWWRIAADALAESEDIDLRSFIDLLCTVWSVPHEAVLQNLPVIVAIVTGEPQMSGGFRSATRIHPIFFSALEDELEQLPVMRLRLGRHAYSLEEAGLSSFGDIVNMVRSDGLARVSATTAKHVMLHLEMLATCITPTGSVDWTAYRELAGLQRLPASAPVSTESFVTGLNSTVEALLRTHPVTKRAPEICIRRTSRDASNRMTLQRVADELRTHLPTIKREETVMLGWLNDAIIEHNFSCLQVWLDESWLRYWSEASDVYEAADDYDGFADNLAWRWRLTRRTIRQAAPLLWAVLDGYPDGRRSGYAPPCLLPAEAAPAGRIRLKGFRRIH